MYPELFSGILIETKNLQLGPSNPVDPVFLSTCERICVFPEITASAWKRSSHSPACETQFELPGCNPQGCEC